MILMRSNRPDGAVPVSLCIMRHRIFLFACVLSATAFASPTDDLKASALGILKAQSAVDGGAVSDFSVDAEVATLDRLIGNAELNDNGLTIARFYRARAALLVNQVRVSNRQKPDAEAARRSLADFDWVIERNTDLPPVGITVADTAYSAGVVARNYLDAQPLAYAYWEKCAQREHAGCLNIMASARITGEGGVKVDVADALELHRKVYATGTGFNCAGAYSALAAAQIIYFSANMQVTVGELDWMKRADLLLDQLAAERALKNPCNRARFKVTEYLLRLERDEVRRDLLEAALRLAEQPEEKATAGYLLGSVSEAAFRDVAAKGTDKDAVCDMHFAAFWHALIRKDPKRSQDHDQAMSGLGRDHCSFQLALARMKYRR